MENHPIYRLHTGLPREAPGSDASTLRALELAAPIPASPSVLDVGCGPGAQTLVLARALGGRITAIDVHDPYLARLRQSAIDQGLQAAIGPLNLAMEELNYPEATFDLIWAEGSIYLQGIAASLSAWAPMLTAQGAIAFTELTWLPGDRPAEAAAYWQQAYPAMESLEGNAARIRSAGFELTGHFVLPASDWWQSYLLPLQRRMDELRGQTALKPELAALIDDTEESIRLYEKYGESFGYVFYITHKAPVPVE